MGEHYIHLTWRERLKIETRRKDGWKPQKIADELGRHVSTIYREKKRGLGVQRTTDLVDYECYIPDIAQEKYEATFSGKGPQLKIGHDHKLTNYLGEVLKDGYRSPEAALGEIEAKGMEFDTKISPRTLYRYIGQGFIPGVSNMDLPHKKNKKDKKKKDKPRAARSAKGKSIEERPKEVNDREEVGHWEMDTVLSAKDGDLEQDLAITERATREQINLKIKNGETASVVAALLKKFIKFLAFLLTNLQGILSASYMPLIQHEAACPETEHQGRRLHPSILMSTKSRTALAGIALHLDLPARLPEPAGRGGRLYSAVAFFLVTISTTISRTASTIREMAAICHKTMVEAKGLLRMIAANRIASIALIPARNQ